VPFLIARFRQPRVGSYDDVRKQAFSAADSLAPRGQPPQRPANLDKRLPHELAAKLRSLFPATRDNSDALNDCYFEVLGSIWDELQAIDKDQFWYELLSPARRAVVLAEELDGEVNNGGFDQYYLNSSGDGAALAPAALKQLGRDKAAAIAERANAQFPGGPPADRALRLKAMDKLGGAAGTAWEQLDTDFYHLDEKDALGLDALVPYILAHESEFFRPG
jgi:hypothetical protein